MPSTQLWNQDPRQQGLGTAHMLIRSILRASPRAEPSRKSGLIMEKFSHRVWPAGWAEGHWRAGPRKQVAYSKVWSWGS